jgi:hypothetical protein
MKRDSDEKALVQSFERGEWTKVAVSDCSGLRVQGRPRSREDSPALETTSAAVACARAPDRHRRHCSALGDSPFGDLGDTLGFGPVRARTPWLVEGAARAHWRGAWKRNCCVDLQG